MEKIFLNGSIINANKASVSVGDSGFLYGTGLFETMRVVNGTVFALDDHLERLFNSAEVLSVHCPFKKKYLKDAIDQTLKKNKLTDARLRLTLTNGSLGNLEQPEPTLLITATKFTPYPQQYYDNGVMVVLTESRQNPTDPTCGHKTTSYFARMLALNEAHQKHAAEALWFTTENLLAEGCVSNVFLVKNSILYTPPLSTPVLPGIARKTVCNIAKEQSIELHEENLTVKDLLAADEVFLTNVVMLALPVIAVEAHTVGDGKPGPVTKKIIDCFTKLVSSTEPE